MINIKRILRCSHYYYRRFTTIYCFF